MALKRHTRALNHLTLKTLNIGVWNIHSFQSPFILKLVNYKIPIPKKSTNGPPPQIASLRRNFSFLHLGTSRWDPPYSLSPQDELF